MKFPILMGNFNDECDGTTNPSKLCTDFNLIDVWSQKYPNLHPRTYQWGKRRPGLLTFRSQPGYQTSQCYGSTKPPTEAEALDRETHAVRLEYWYVDLHKKRI